MKRVLILTDYRDQFWLTVRHKQASFRIDRLREDFEKAGYAVTINQFSELDLTRGDLAGTLVLYQSTEDPALLYNDFITDVLLALQERGAVLIPDFRYHRAHHNKVFMEMLRMTSPVAELRSVKSRWFGAYPEYERFVNSPDCRFPQVVKLGEGSGSRNVVLIRNRRESRGVRKLMWHSDLKFQIKDFIKSIWKSRYPNFRAQTNARRKIIVQEYLPGLTGDFKVLGFGKKFYVLHRAVRPHDFRASGSGLFEFPEAVSDKLLNFAETVFHSFDTPFISMDIAETAETCHLIEFQFVSFGTYTLERAPWHFERDGGAWCRISGTDDLEHEFCTAAIDFAETKEAAR